MTRAPQPMGEATVAAALLRLEGHEKLCTERWEQVRSTIAALTNLTASNRNEAIKERSEQHAQNQAAINDIYRLLWRAVFFGGGIAGTVILALLGALLTHGKGP